MLSTFNRKEKKEKPHPLQERLGTIFSLLLLTKSSFLYVIKQWFSAPAFGTVRGRPGAWKCRSQISGVAGPEGSPFSGGL